MSKKIKCGFVAIVGRPNAGKSTLVNALVGQKVSIVSPKAQTTRNNIIGVVNSSDYQIVLVDTPGQNSAKNGLDDYMQKSIKGAVSGVDLVVVAIDGSKASFEQEKNIINKYTGQNIPVVVAVTKIDLLTGEKLFKVLSSFNNLDNVQDIVPISSVKNRNIDELIKVMLKFLPEIDEKNRYYGEDEYTDKSLKFICSEIIREKALYFLDKEIPHGIAVSIVSYKEGEGLTSVDAEIICEKDSHKNIIIGKGGSMLKKIGHEARVSFQKVIQQKVDLHLWVRVKENWRDNIGFLNDIGYNNKEI